MTKLSDLLAGQSNLVTDQDIAPVATSGSYSDLTNKPTLSTVATTGSYNDLTNKPTLSNVATTGSYNDLTNKPVIISLKITSISYPGDDLAADPAGGQTITIIGSGFVDTPMVYVNDTIAPSVTFVSSTQLTITTPAKTAGTYNLYVINSDGSTAIKVMGISYSGTPAWTTAAGSLGTSDSAISFQLQAISNSSVVYTLASGSTLPSGVTLSSSGLVSGTASVEQTFSFSVDATDAENQTTPRSFSVTVSLSEPYFKYVTMLLRGEGVNGSQNNTFLDSSTNNFTITRNGNTTQGSFSPYGTGWSNYFDGSSALSCTGPASGTGAFTAECWVNFSVAPTGYVVVMKCSTNGSWDNGWNIVTDGNGKIGTYNGGGTTNGIQNLTANRWYHLSLTRDASNTLRFFIDGVLSGSATGVTTNYSSTLFSIGSEAPIAYAMNGYVSNARVVVGTALYTNNFTPNAGPLTAVSGTSVLTCQSNRFVDNSANALALTITGTPSVQRFNPFGTSTAYSTATIGGSMYMSSASSTLTVSDSSFAVGTGDFTIEGWYYSPNTYFELAGSANTGTSNNGIILSGYICLVGAASSGDSISVTPQYNAWTYLAFTRSSGTLYAYVNGVQVGTKASSRSINKTTFVIGSNYTDVNDGSAGYMCDVRFSTTARYTGSTMTVPTAPLTSDASTKFLLGFTNGAIYDNAMMNDLETVGNAQISTSVKKYGTGSLYFDGTGDYLSAPNIPPDTLGGGDFTVEMWINLASNTTQQTIITKGGQNPIAADANGWSLFIYSSTLYFFIRDGSGSGNLNSQFCSSGTWTAAVANNTWAHLAIVRSGTTITAYANGVSLGSLTSASNPVTTDPLIVGAAFSIANYMAGYIDDLRITKGYARYTSTFTPPASALKVK